MTNRSRNTPVTAIKVFSPMEDFKWVPKLIRREMITFPSVFEWVAYYANQLANMVLRIATNTPIIEIPAIKPAATGTKYDSA